MSGIYAARRAKDARPPRGPPGPSGGCAAFTIVAPCRLRAASRRPWSVEATDACFIVRDASGQARAFGPVAELVGIEGGVVSGVFNLESSDVGASDRRPRHEERYHEV